MNALKKLIASLLFAILSTSAFAITDNQVFAYAEANYPTIFAGAATSGKIQTYNYRLYKTSQNYLAVSGDDIFVYGPYTSNSLVRVASASALESIVTAWEAKLVASSGAASASCNTASAPAGLNYAQTGNSIDVTTTGCIAVPTAGLCTPSAPSQATGINVLVTSTASSVRLSGITFKIPGGYNPLDAAASAYAGGKICTQNAPASFSSLNIKYDVCYDITSQLQSSVAALQSSGFVTVSTPLTVTAQGLATMQTVTDCTTSGADIISDAFTGKVSIKQADGTYKTY